MSEIRVALYYLLVVSVVLTALGAMQIVVGSIIIAFSVCCLVISDDEAAKAHQRELDAHE